MAETKSLEQALNEAFHKADDLNAPLDQRLKLYFGESLVFWVGDKIKETYRQFGIDLERFQGNGGWLLPIPATLVVGTEAASRLDSWTRISATAWGSSLFCVRWPTDRRPPCSIGTV